MNTVTTIKYKESKEVYWLSSKGFTKGIVKTIRFNSDKHRTETKYFLLSNTSHEGYMGDEVPEELIFTSYQSMLEYYSKQFTEVLPVSDPVKERIKVGKMSFRENGEYLSGEMKWNLQFKTNKHIHYDNAVEICNLLERYLNGEMNNPAPSALNDTVVPKHIGCNGLFAPLFNACRELIDAPHQQHFALRFNDEEMAAFEKIKKLTADNPFKDKKCNYVYDYCNPETCTCSKSFAFEQDRLKSDTVVEMGINQHLRH